MPFRDESDLTCPTVSIVIPTYKRPEDLARCLSAIDRMEPKPDQVIVVYREGDEPTRDLVLKWEQSNARYAKVTESINKPGQVAALNAGVHCATCDVVAFLDDDTEPSSNWVARLRKWFSSDPTVAGVGGRDIIVSSHYDFNVSRSRWTNRVGTVTWYGRCVGNHHVGAEFPMEVDVLKGCNMAYRRELARFDENLRGTGAQVHNELVLGLWLRDCGYRLIYDPEMVVKHFVAERFDEDGRTVRSKKAIENEGFNQVYAIGSRPRFFKALMGVMYSILVGSRSTPGLARLIFALVQHESKTVSAFLPAMKGKISAVLFLTKRKWTAQS
jgi:cellulose synthase/poly-beta-1,6-N-acetylglucosamine synthase-like glycosyltransferase